MGAESSAARTPRLEESPVTLLGGLSVYRATLDEEQLASVFVYQRGNEDTVNKAAKHLKTLRHPCLLRFLSSTIEADGIHLVTERVQPLHMVLEDVSADEICAGIYDILQALIFLHDRGKLSHNNICISSVFVSEDGHWKLGGMETMCHFSQASPEFLSSIKSLRDLSGIAPEEQSSGFQILPESHGHARDAYSFGMMVAKLLPLLNDMVAEHLLAKFQETLNATLLNPDPMQRLCLRSLLSHAFFRNEFLEIVNFLQSLTLKTEEEKNEFFKFLLDRVQALPESLMASRLVPQLLTPLVFAEPVAIKSFLPHLLRPKTDASGDEFICLLSPNAFREHVIPVLLKLFSVREEHVRMVLLAHLDTYADLFSLEDLQEIILPQILLGLRDTSNTLVSGTLSSLAVLVPLLGAEVVVGGERAKIFKRATPNFRSTEITPEGSPTHVINSNEHLSSLALSNSVKPFSKKLELEKKRTTGREKVRANFSENSQPAKFHLLTTQAQYKEQTAIMSIIGNHRNEILGVDSAQSSMHTHKCAEDWPDWSKPDNNEILLESKKDCILAENNFGNITLDDEPWDNFEAENGQSNAITEEQAVKPHISNLSPFGNKSQSKGMKLSSALKIHSEMPGESWKNNCKQQKVLVEEKKKTNSITQIPSRQRTTIKKASLHDELGEEFTISVKKRPERDPELDLFADMIPDIKLSSTGLLVPTQGSQLAGSAKETEVASRGTEVLTDRDNSQTLTLASKFAATDTVEMETEGWDDDLNWEDNTW
ncbi:protein-associating with the carboxyl-terminal domain of ezrin isoform X2 [Hemitrygon akajei]|uniref:protein-associating with the carboxyl-terminal domain of ezrin isoform X2 n=1 Tax=Hemitrygon akajei TaxID=2704970 RepID=UPI003BFA1898